MNPYRDAQEAFNRASFDPPTPELVPAEAMRPVEILRTIPAREIAGWFAVFGLLAGVAAGFVVVAS